MEAALGVFSALATQWRLAPNGRPYGLDYNTIPFLLKCHSIPEADHLAVMDDLRILEDEALIQMRS